MENSDLYYESPNLSFEFVQRQLKNPPHWSEDVLLAWHDAYPRDCQTFVTKHYWSDEASIKDRKSVV